MAITRSNTEDTQRFTKKNYYNELPRPKCTKYQIGISHPFYFDPKHRGIKSFLAIALRLNPLGYFQETHTFFLKLKKLRNLCVMAITLSNTEDTQRFTK